MRAIQQLRQQAAATNRAAAPPSSDRQFLEVGGPGQPHKLVLVRVKKIGGVAGSETTECTWVYNIYPPTADVETDEPWAEELSPLIPRRTAIGEYEYAEDGSYGTAFRDPETGAWVLWAAQEREAVEGCSG